MSTVAEKYLIKFNAYDYLHHKTMLLVVFNILVTFTAIHYFSLYGAIFAILATEILSLTIFNYFYKQGLILDTHIRIFRPSTYFKR